MAFADKLKAVALEQLQWWDAGNHVECSSSKPQGSKRVEKYWKEGLHLNGLTGCDISQAWSAAFICYCLRQADMPDVEFPFAAGHHTYIRWAINNTKQSKPNKTYYGHKLADYQPQPGDLIAQWRPPAPNPRPSFDHQPSGFYPSHCDIVVAVSSTVIEAVGGNLSNSVRRSTFSATNGRLNPFASAICVMECKKT